MATLTRDDVRRVALLSRLALDDEELDRFAVQLESIVAYMDTLNRVDVSSVPESSRFHGVPSRLRPDVPHDAGMSEDVLDQAPERAGAYIKVERVIE
jgi:aspartyl-tRNA(Asn)/glutamyl-tRNA(Gln) amidotransferase subunit C